MREEKPTLNEKKTQKISLTDANPYPVPVALPDSPVKPYKPDVEQKNVIPEPEVTEAPRPRLQPFDYEGGVYIGGPGENVAKFREEDYGEERGDGGNEENQVDSEEPPRGDVFSECPVLLKKKKSYVL